MHRDFLGKYSQEAKISKMLLQNIYHTLLHDSSAAEYSFEAHCQVDERVAKAVIEIDDSEIILDLRWANGNRQWSVFDEF